MSNPQFQQVFNKMLDVRMVQERAKLLGECSNSTLLTNVIPHDNFMTTTIDSTPGKHNLNRNQNRENPNPVKSPSDTTIYAPALQRVLTPEQVVGAIGRVRLEKTPNQNNLMVQQQISNFVETVRKEQEEIDDVRQSPQQPVAGTSSIKATNAPPVASKVIIPGLEEAQNRAASTVLEAEKFRAAIEKPTGNVANLDVLDLLHNVHVDSQDSNKWGNMSCLHLPSA